MKFKTTNPNITELKKDEIFVFGSNLSGIHGAGAAKLAETRFGAIRGVATGLQGNCFAIPTKDRDIYTSLTIDQIKPYIDEFIRVAILLPHLTFLVTEIGCGLAGHKPEDIAPLFKEVINLENVYLPERFWEVLSLNK